ncbi:MAG: extracellular solute-binding protein [Vallitalea sp.]|jgi:ABC-type glycerol-3-phosphate transport system substrate-binding protein|nr:extracellular solute-binding protein [Vallitalea sp.]
MKKIAILLSVLMIVQLLFIGCSQEKLSSENSNNERLLNSDSDSVEISVLVFETANLTQEFWDDIINRFEAVNPSIKVEKQIYPDDRWDDYQKILNATGQLPDVILEGLKDLKKIDGVLAEMPEDIVSLFKEDYIEKINDKVYVTYPVMQIKGNLYYNIDLFKQAGIVEPPKTFDEFVSNCETLKEAGIVPLVTGGPEKPWMTGMLWSETMITAGMSTVSKNYMNGFIDGSLKWNGPEFKKTLTDWKQLIDAGYYHEGSFSFSYAQACDEFKSGKVAMICNGSWFAKDLDSSKLDFEVGYMPLPYPNNLEYFSSAISQPIAVSNNSQNKDAAFAFVKFLVENDEVYKKYLEADGSFPTRKQAIELNIGETQQKLLDATKDMIASQNLIHQSGDWTLPAGIKDVILSVGRNIFSGGDIDKELDYLEKIYREVQDN